MAIGKHEYYEGAALRGLICSAPAGLTIRHAPPLYIVGDRAALLLKYSASVRSPWLFALSAIEYSAARNSRLASTYLALICGGDGIAALTIAQLAALAPEGGQRLSISTRRRRNEYYRITAGGGARLSVSPSQWRRVLEGICPGSPTPTS